MVYRLYRYIFIEIFKSAIWGSLISIVILISLQALRLSRRIIQLDLDFSYIVKMTFGLAIGFLPIVLPISFLIALLVVFGRMASNREFITMQSIGYSPNKTMRPVFVASLIFAIFTLWVSFDFAPFGYRLFQTTLSKGMGKRITSVLKEKTFNTNFLDMMIYVDKINEEHPQLQGVIIQDDSNFKESVSIIAESGHWDVDSKRDLGVLKLKKGMVLSSDLKQDKTRIIEFDDYTLNASFQIRDIQSKVSPPSLNWGELREKELIQLGRPNGDPKPIWIEFARRFALAFFCVLIVPLCFALSLSRGRAVKNRAIMLSLAVAGSYWLVYSSLVTWTLKTDIALLRESTFYTWFIIWMPNFLIAGIGYSLFKIRTQKPAKI